MKLQIKVTPSSSKDCIVGWLENALKIKVKAPADRGKANKAVIKLLERNLELAKGSISITNGTTSGNKIIEIDAINDDAIHQKLSAILNN
jgi:uncharacterized protein (TIGR00251 family)